MSNILVTKASDIGMVSGQDVTELLHAFLAAMAQIGDEKVLDLEGGTYYINSREAFRGTYYMTNTISPDELRRVGRTDHTHAVALPLIDLHDFTIEGHGAQLVLDGVMTNVVVSHCTNVTVRDLTISTVRPNLHAMRVEKAGFFHADFRLVNDDEYVHEGNEWYFVGTDYRLGIRQNRFHAFWITAIREAVPDEMLRVVHPLATALSLREKSKGLFRARYAMNRRIRRGDEYYIFDTLRLEAGVFIEHCREVTIERFTQHFNYSLAVVAQDSEDLFLRQLSLIPPTGYKMCSLADFIQICMCRGRIEVTDCTFSGAGDDVMNVHGFHFPITERRGDTIIVRFGHEQAYGFCAFHEYDLLSAVDTATLSECGTARISAVRRLDEFSFAIDLMDIQGDIGVGRAIEDVSACPAELLFARNRMDRIVTRGLLLTTRGKVRIQDNNFVSTGMAGILISDDASSWYESGRVEDVQISGNTFDSTRDYSILIKPENKRFGDYIHRGITITDNTFNVRAHTCIYARAVSGLTIRGNAILGNPTKVLDLAHVEKLDTDIDKD